jgi:hypothetical protein
MRIVGYENLHQHTFFSLLDGYASLDELAVRAKNINQKYLCVTDHGSLGAIPKQIKAAEENKLKYIFGCELYCNPMQPEIKPGDEMANFTKNLNQEERKKLRKSYHILALAYNNTGYSNLVKLSSWAWTRGFYQKPRVNHEQLMNCKEGIIFTSCCYNSEIGQAFDQGGEEAGFAMIEKYMAMFGDKFYLEIMLLDFKKQKPYDIFIIKASEKYKLPIICTGDVHYANPEDSKMQRLMLMIQTKKTLKEIEEKKALDETADFFELQDTNLWMKSEEELNDKWEKDYSDVIDKDIFEQSKINTVKICEIASGVEIDRSIKLPKLDCEADVLKEKIEEGFKKRRLPNNAKYKDRIEEEYNLICQKGFASYFLIQKKMVDEARRVCPELLGWGDGSEALGAGRGCLAGDVPLYTQHGLVKDISKIERGEFVYTIDGSLQKVLNKMCYDIKDEELLSIFTCFSDYGRLTLTKDHEIYAAKEDLQLKWYRSDELNLGDWVFVPKIQMNNLIESEDLDKFAGNEYFPNEIFDFNQQLKYDFVKRCILSYGHYDKTMISFWFKTFEFASKLKLLLASLKIPASLLRKYKKGSYYFKVNVPHFKEIAPADKRYNSFKVIENGILLKIQKIEVAKGIKKVYDIEVENNSNYLTTTCLVHNSAVGSLICYCLGITDVDPIEHELLFSRFLSPARGGKSLKLRFNIDPI